MGSALSAISTGIELRHLEILPVRYVGDVVERLAERPRGIDADARRNPHGAVLAEIDRAADEIVDLTRDLIRIPTVNPPGEAYADCAIFIGERPSTYSA